MSVRQFEHVGIRERTQLRAEGAAGRLSRCVGVRERDEARASEAALIARLRRERQQFCRGRPHVGVGLIGTRALILCERPNIQPSDWSTGSKNLSTKLYNCGKLGAETGTGRMR
jgi:hypothetical protein